MKNEIAIGSLSGDTLTILEGKALEQRQPLKIEIRGDINSVSNFLKVRKVSGTGFQAIDISKAIITVNKFAKNIFLETDPENVYGSTVSGNLEQSKEIEQFFINSNKTFSKLELVKLLKFNKLYFADATKHAEMLLAFQKVESSVSIKQNDSSDDRGNKERAFVKEVISNAPTEFILDIPIFKGFPHVTFRVEVCLDVTEGSVKFWFESTELHELIQSSINAIFEGELKCAEGFVIINQ